MNLDSVESVSVAVLVERIGSLSGVRLREVCRALEVAATANDSAGFRQLDDTGQVTQVFSSRIMATRSL